MAAFNKLLHIIIFICVLFSIQYGYAADVYLDISATSCNDNGTANTNYSPSTRACGAGSDKVYGGSGAGGGWPYEASQGLANGDNLYIRAGEYYQDVSGKGGYTYAWGALHILANNITISNYNGEQVWLKGGASKTSVVAHTNNPIDLSGDGITLTGSGYNLYVYGCVIVAGTGNTITGIDASGGWDHQSAIGADAWYDIFRFLNSTNATVSNSKVHDNYNHGTVTAAANKAAFMHDGDNNTTIENSSIYNLVSIASYCKYQSASGTIHATYDKNFFNGYGLIQGPNSDQGKIIKVYQNVAVSTTLIGFSEGLSVANGFTVYNNTIWGNGAKLISSYTGNIPVFNVYNNIVVNTGSSVDAIAMDNAASPGAGYYFNYNDYFGTYTFRWSDASHTFAAWQTFLSDEANSITTDPGFSASDGVVDGSSPTDFKRTAYTTNGKDASVMGAYITGMENIGLLTSSSFTLKNVSGSGISFHN